MATYPLSILKRLDKNHAHVAPDNDAFSITNKVKKTGIDSLLKKYKRRLKGLNK